MIVPLLLAALTLQAPTPSPTPGRETAIDFATGSLRDWQVDKADPSVIYVRDRTLRWYRVALTGDCPRTRRYNAMSYTTDNNGRFDRFSRISFAPNIVCGVTSIRTSAPPPGQPGHKPGHKPGHGAASPTPR